MFKPSSNAIYWPFQGGASFVDLFFIIYVSCLSLLRCLVCSFHPCDHLLGKGWPHGSLMCCVVLCFCHFPMWCPGSGPIITRLALTMMYCNRLHAWWSTQSQLATLRSSLIAPRWVGLQTLWRFRLINLSIDEMVGAWCFGVSGPPGFTCWISLTPVFSFIYCWVLIFALSPFYILISMFYKMVHGYVRGLSCKPNIYVSWSTSGLRVRLACGETGLSPPVKYFYWPF